MMVSKRFSPDRSFALIWEIQWSVTTTTTILNIFTVSLSNHITSSFYELWQIVCHESGWSRCWCWLRKIQAILIFRNRLIKCSKGLKKREWNNLLMFEKGIRRGEMILCTSIAIITKKRVTGVDFRRESQRKSLNHVSRWWSWWSLANDSYVIFMKLRFTSDHFLSFSPLLLLSWSSSSGVSKREGETDRAAKTCEKNEGNEKWHHTHRYHQRRSEWSATSVSIFGWMTSTHRMLIPTLIIVVYISL